MKGAPASMDETGKVYWKLKAREVPRETRERRQGDGSALEGGALPEPGY